MSVKFLFFAQCSDWMEMRQLDLPVNAPTSVDHLLDTDPRFQPLKERLSYIKIAINNELTTSQAEVRDGDEVAFMPPYSGG